MTKKILLLVIILLNICYAQKPIPADALNESYLFVNGTIHIGSGKIINNGSVGFSKGTIDYVGTGNDKLSANYKHVINISDKHLYPGFIVLNSQLGLSEIGAVRATKDYSDVGKFNPSVRALIAYNSDSKVIPTVRTNGVLITQAVPFGGSISGSSSVFNLDGWNWEDAVLKADEGIHLFWPQYYKRNRSTRMISASKNYSNEVNDLRLFMLNAQAYNNSKPIEEINLKFEAMKKVFRGEGNLYIHANNVQEIKDAIHFAAEQKIRKVVLVGAKESYKCIDILKKHHVKIILNGIHSLPNSKGDDYDRNYKLPQKLISDGLVVALGRTGATAARNIPFEIGTAAAYGLNKEEAVKMISLNPAIILGIDDKVGSVEVGKYATLFISDGDALDMKSNKIIYAFIEGKKIDLNNEQTELYKRYMNKYKLKSAK